MSLPALVPLVVAGPLALGALLLALAHVLPRRVPDALAILAALAVAALCLALCLWTLRHGPIAYWFGGWRPRPGVVLGVGFGVDPASAAVCAFIALLFAASLGFAFGYFDAVHAHFHVLMLLFLAALMGFCLTRDLFNLFVWFEVMSVAAFALTGFRLETDALGGALNFTIVNSLASFVMLAGVGLAYARTGFLDFAATEHAVAVLGRDPVLTAAFCLLAAALMIKGAILPFHLWLSDAHAVAPSPVSVIFSGAMVSAALFVLSKLAWQVFAASPDARALLHGLLPVLGCATAVVGGLLAWAQRHLKRLLAFSTIAHLGIMLAGLSALTGTGAAGLLAYVVGHGLVKGALFMVVGILLATRASVDELDLRGLGRGVWPAGVVMALGGLLLAGAPWGLLDAGSDLLHAAGEGWGGAWAAAAMIVGEALTGAAVLRAAGRIFLGLGPDPGDKAKAPTRQEQEDANRPLWLMMIPCAGLLALDLAPPSLARAAAGRVFPLFAHPWSGDGPPLVLPAPSLLQPWIGVILALVLAALALWRERLPKALSSGTDRLNDLALGWLYRLHSGLVPDYVAWLVAGLALFPAALALR